jgi:hypothetical protein
LPCSRQIYIRTKRRIGVFKSGTLRRCRLSLSAGVLASGGNVATGNVIALAGLADANPKLFVHWQLCHGNGRTGS